MQKSFWFFLFVIFFVPLARAEGTFGKGQQIQSRPRIVQATARRSLTTQEVERVKAFKEYTREVDKKSVQAVVDELEKSEDPGLNLQVQEAIARTYADIVLEQKTTDQKQKEWLYSMVAINMAYLELGAQQDESGNGLNQLIRRKLRGYLSDKALQQLKAQYKIEDPRRLPAERP